MLAVMRQRVFAFLGSAQFGLVMVILLLSALLTAFAGSHQDAAGHSINNFLNPNTLMQVATETSTFAIMAVGATMVIITAGIDLSVGSTYALAGVSLALIERWRGFEGTAAVFVGLVVALGVGVICGVLNGVMVCGLKVHPFIITLGTMWIFRGVAFVTSKAESIVVPASLTDVAKANLGLPQGLYPVPMLVMLATAIAGWIYLSKMVAGRYVYAVGGNSLASVYSGVRVNRVLIGVYAICGLTAGISAFVGSGYFGSTSSGDAQGYELYVIASAVVGGVSLTGGKGNAISAMLGALLIVLMREAIRLLHFDTNYEWIIVGCAIIVAVVLDRLSGTLGARRLAKSGG